MFKCVLSRSCCISLLLLICIFSVKNVYAIDKKEYKDVIGMTIGAGVTEIKNQSTLTGEFVYINLFYLGANGTLEYKDFGDFTITNSYVGYGLGKYLQLQVGNGSKGYVYRARSEFTLYKKLNLVIYYEHYDDDHKLDNYGYGLGYSF
ncbi:MAG: hypothetical protein OEZ33_09475 [Gammaproteobacteria bacterium]|nr:hypothetical protein [Gammaproteobacteria bacterium]